MKIINFETKDEWIKAREGRITGSILKNIIVKRGKGKKIGFYQLIAEKIAIQPDDNETPLDRGVRLESVALSKFSESTKKEIISDLVMWVREENDNIALSPDGYTEDLKEAVEVKCLSSARHLEAYLTKKVPKDYEDQVIQYFIVNDELEVLHFCLYDDRMPEKLQLFTIEVKREDVQKKIDEYLAYEEQTLSEIEEIIKELTF